MGDALEFRILGPLEVRLDDDAVQIGGPRQRALLALLLCNANRVVSRDRLIDELLGDQPADAAKRMLHVQISRLRTALNRGVDDRSRVIARAPGYLLRVEPGELDLERFEELLAEGQRAAEAGEFEQASLSLREAESLWRGRPLADLEFEPFARIEVERLEELRLLAAEERIDAELAVGYHARLVSELEARVAESPLRERLRGQLMLALYRSGRQADALQVYRSARLALVGDLGIEPSVALRELEQAILRQDPGLELGPAAEPERSVLVATLDPPALESLLALGASLAREPGRELIVTRLVNEQDRLAAESAALHERRERLLADGITTRAAAFTSRSPGDDAVRIASELDCDLLLVDAPPGLLESPVLRAILVGAPCDVAALVGGQPVPGPLLVPFVGAEHDWTAIELGAWLARVWQVPLRLGGPSTGARDSSRLLASASLAIQRAHGVAAEPLLLDVGSDQLVQAAAQASLVIAGLSDRWQREGLGRARGALARSARTPVLLVRRGLRPGGLAPRESLTRFTWSLSPHPA